MTLNEIRTKYLEFMQRNGHVIIPSDSLVPKDDPTTLFTSAGMQPMLPYLLGENHPKGTRITDSQKCFRADDIDEAGDNRHTTFFEMLGNWSLGDYFKEQQLKWFFTFLVDELGLDPNKLYVTVFIGDPDNGIPKDTQAAAIWDMLFTARNIDAKAVEIGSEHDGGKKGMQGGRIFYYDAAKNWWSRGGTPDTMPIGEPGGPDAEVFYDFETEHNPDYGEHCHPNCDCGRFMEIGNSVFMMYKKVADGVFEELPKRNIDFGGGLERIASAVNNDLDMFRAVDVLSSSIDTLEKNLPMPYKDNPEVYRVIADHLRASVFMMSDGVAPSNKEEGYILRRLIRRTVLKTYQLNITSLDWIADVVTIIATSYQNVYPELAQKQEHIIEELEREAKKFHNTIKQGLKAFEKLDNITGQDAFNLFTSHGFPLELTLELAEEQDKSVDVVEYNRLFEEHRALSKKNSQSKFGGHGLLLDNGEIKAVDEAELVQCTKLHTATHLLQAALRQVLGDEVHQDGSDITAKRLRFDFSFKRKLADDEKKQVEDLVNQKIQENLDVWHNDMSYDEAIKSGALYFHKIKYPDTVKVYSMGHQDGAVFSKEFCGGPHVDQTQKVGEFKIIKEEAVSSGTRRIRAIVT